MNVVSVAARRWYISTWTASGARPIAAPPLTADTFKPAMLDGADVLYICLHGLPDQPFFYGADWSTAVSAGQIAACKLDGAVVYLAGCFGQGPMTDALLSAGAAAVVGDADSTWAGYVLPTGSNALGQRFMRGLRAGLAAGPALTAAQASYMRTYDGPRHAALISTVGLTGNANAKARAV